MRRTATRSLKLGDDKDSLDVKVRFTQMEAKAERVWKARMMKLLTEGPTHKSCVLCDKDTFSNQ